jgi:hypothetical protein
VLDARALLNLQLALTLALMLGCATPNYTGPSTARCLDGGVYTETADARQLACNGDLVVTGSVSDNATSIFTTALAGIAGWFAAP